MKTVGFRVSFLTSRGWKYNMSVATCELVRNSAAGPGSGLLAHDLGRAGRGGHANSALARCAYTYIGRGPTARNGRFLTPLRDADAGSIWRNQPYAGLPIERVSELGVQPAAQPTVEAEYRFAGEIAVLCKPDPPSGRKGNAIVIAAEMLDVRHECLSLQAAERASEQSSSTRTSGKSRKA
jgi:hypothetical protein